MTVNSIVHVLFQNMWTEYNIEKYGWRGSLIWNAGLSLQLCVFGSLIFPLHWPQVTNIESGPSTSSTYNTPFFLSAGNISFGEARLT